MSKPQHDISSLEATLQAADEKLSQVALTDAGLQELALELSQFSDHANEAGRADLFQGAQLLVRILELSANLCSEFENDPPLVQELLAFVKQSVPVLQTAIGSSEQHPCREIDALVDFANEKWCDYLELDGRAQAGHPAGEADHWDEASDFDDPTDVEEDSELETPPEISSSQIEILLSAVEQSSGPVGSSESVTASAEESNLLPAGNRDADTRSELASDRDMLEAFLDDSQRCLSAMEQTAIALEETPGDLELVRQFCRELHTLKGASATVGLSDLASYFHELESSLEELFAEAPSQIATEPLFAAVDRVREEIGQLQVSSDVASHTPTPTNADARRPDDTALDNSNADDSNLTSTRPAVNDYHLPPFGDDSSIRIRAEKLDRLMDMLAELVVLRNRRESHVNEFNHFNDELTRCATRLNLAEENFALDRGRDRSGSITRSIFDSSRSVLEISKDIASVSQGLRELQKPFSSDNGAISGFIRNFRQELMQLRRVPVVSLFNRLRRAARDAAKSESKQIRIQVTGEQTGLEQEIQERLFESLLHIVRNAVSHGIETADQRQKAGKEPTGNITLAAYSSAQVMIIEVRDDGQGVDYQAVRKRAIDKGLLKPGQNPSHEEITNLLFHPGFSTKQQASEVSGRGVGMDIVSCTIERLRGKIEVDSVAGQGTTLRLLIPLRTGIEHVMVFRSNGQLFALPMQSVTAAKSSSTNSQPVARLFQSSTVNSNDEQDTTSNDVLLLNRGPDFQPREPGSSSADANFALAVDELIGPEEVVVRGLPNLLKNHPLFCGITLSGTGESVLLLDSHRVVDFCQRTMSDPSSLKTQETFGESNDQRRALVIDDSITARKALAKLLHQFEYTTVEAGDGIEAIERLRRERFDLVFTDLDMPRLGGLELLADIQSGRYCDAPVVVVSSRESAAFQSQAIDAGASDYLTKPVSKNSISQLLESLQPLAETIEG